MRFINKAKNVFVLLKSRWNRIGKRKIDFYSRKYDLGYKYFLVFLFIYGIFFFQITARVTVAVILKSWQLFFDALPQFAVVLVIYIVVVFLLAYVRKVTLYTLAEEPKQRPQILWNHKIAKAALRVLFVSYYLSIFATFLLMSMDNFPNFAKQWSVLIFSALATFTAILFLFGFSMFLKLNNKEIVLYGLDYLSRIQGQERKTLINRMGLISRAVVENLHKIFLSHWKFIQQIDLWPQFNVILLGLICGNENERTATTAFLKKLYRMIKGADDPENYRLIAESLHEFQMSMESLCELKDKTMIAGRPTIRRPVLERIKDYAPIATVVGTLIAVLAFIIQMILTWITQ